MPAGFAGFPRDPSTGKSVGTAQSFLSSLKSTKSSSSKIWSAMSGTSPKHSSTTTSSSKAKEAEASSYRTSTDTTSTLPTYSEATTQRSA
ncbi:hypothetical protein K402DRAFT_394023 [Aulographum hederae CBS 113979]|uniref:Uncharacterized protein n=1 Tax=Aulographum hederae CBS 113979 TaxID=1176131 RepID=A0A6G1GYY1_9PEZI|nr:hypothetical protein K402DRAFT_394023 [Aulographum hederae CBS 113979]